MAVSSTSVKFFTLRMLVLQSRSSCSLEIVWQFRPAINMMSPAHHAQHTTMWSTQPCAAHGRARTPFCQIHHRPPCPPVQGGSAIFGTFCCTIWKHNIAELTSKQYHAHFSICMFFLVSWIFLGVWIEFGIFHAIHWGRRGRMEF